MFSAGDPDDKCQEAIETLHVGRIDPADPRPAPIAPNRHDLVDHHLRWLQKSGLLICRESEAKQRASLNIVVSRQTRIESVSGK